MSEENYAAFRRHLSDTTGRSELPVAAAAPRTARQAPTPRRRSVDFSPQEMIDSGITAITSAPSPMASHPINQYFAAKAGRPIPAGQAPTPQQRVRRDITDEEFNNAVRENGLLGASSTTQKNPYIPSGANSLTNHPVYEALRQRAESANHPFNVFARELQQQKQPISKPSGSSARSVQVAAATRPAKSPRGVMTFTNEDMRSAGLDRAGLRAAHPSNSPSAVASSITAALDKLPGALPASATSSFSAVPPPSHGMIAQQVKPAARPSVAIEDPWAASPVAKAQSPHTAAWPTAQAHLNSVRSSVNSFLAGNAAPRPTPVAAATKPQPGSSAAPASQFNRMNLSAAK